MVCYLFRIHGVRDAANAYISLLFSEASEVFKNFSNIQSHSFWPVLAIP